LICNGEWTSLKKVLFLIPNLMHGGAERVLINLVNNMDTSRFDVTLQTIFNVGVNRKYLKEHVKYKYVFSRQFRGNSKVFKLFPPRFLFKLMVREKYDIIVSYLEGPCARIVSGCNNPNTRLLSWIHIELGMVDTFTKGFRSYNEAVSCYNRFDDIICVSETVRQIFLKISGLKKIKTRVLYNTNETEEIIIKSHEEIERGLLSKSCLNICSVAKVIETKGYDRLARAHKRLIEEGIFHKIFILGIGREKEKIEKYLSENNISDSFIFLGYKDNPYKYVEKCDLYVCSSRREGFSTAVTESLIVGTPVVTTLCSGMEELLGDSEFGLIVENSEDGIYKGLKTMLCDRELLANYKLKAAERGLAFSKEKTVRAVEEALDE